MINHEHNYYLDFFRLPSGKFKLYSWSQGDQIYGTIHGDQYLPPSVIHPPGAYFTDDFGDCFVVYSCEQRRSNIGQSNFF